MYIMVEIALPTDLPKLEDPVPASAPAPGTKRKATIHFNTNECDNRLIKEQANLEYLEEMKIRPFLNVMLAELYRFVFLKKKKKKKFTKNLITESFHQTHWIGVLTL